MTNVSGIPDIPKPLVAQASLSVGIDAGSQTRMSVLLTIVFLLFLLPTITFSQNKRDVLDSLLRALPAQYRAPDDTNKVQFYNELSRTHRLFSNEPQKALRYADTARILAHRLGALAGEALA